MNVLRKLAVVIFAMSSSTVALADTIEFDLNYTLGPISGDFGDLQRLSDNAVFFPDRPITLSEGDTLIFNVLFNQRLQVFDLGDPSAEVFFLGLDCGRSCDGVAFSGDWTSSIEALGGRGDIWSGPITRSFTGGGIGFGWGGVPLEVTDSRGSFTGIRWTTTFTSFREGDPLTVSAFAGFSGSADGFRLLPRDIPVTIDIKPGSDPNSINLKSKGKIPVAILADTFDATQVNWETVMFGPDGATESHGRAHVKDVDRDGDMDMVLHFKTQETGIAWGDTEATLTGETFSGEAITGTDAIRIVKCH